MTQNSSANLHLSKPMYSLKENLDEILFPSLQPYQEGALQVSDLHTIWYAQYGNSQGLPVIFLHGGPGLGCGLNDMRYFDPEHYRIIHMDQRGAKRSKPFAELQDNTTQDLIADLELLRSHLKIDKWVIFGGSWGSALALLYGEAHPTSCLGFILRGIFLARKADAENIWHMDETFPELWDKMQSALPEAERADLPTNFCKRALDPSLDVSLPAARAFMEYDLKAGTLVYNQENVEKLLADDGYILSTMRIFCTYYKNNFFIEENQILNNLHKIKHLPLSIVHGRYDTICRLKSSYEVWQNWPNSELTIVQDAGHTLAEPGIVKELIRATEKFRMTL